MKLLAGLLFIFFTNSALPQHDKSIFSIELAIQYAYPTTPQELAKQLTASYNTELEKTSAIFRWITENISYRPRFRPGKRDVKLKRYGTDEIEDDGPLKPTKKI